MKNVSILLLLGMVCISGCRPHRPAYVGLHFSIMPASHTGVHFKNTITENDSVNLFNNEYSYMGGGVVWPRRRIILAGFAR